MTVRCITGITVALLLACGGKKESIAPVAKAPAAPAATSTAAQTTTQNAQPPSSGDTSIGSMMPAYTAQTLDGKPYDLASERGQVVLLNLWATWCGPCRYEIPELQKTHDKYAARGFKVVGISLDDTGAEGVRQFVTEHKMTYPIVLDADGKIANLFQTSSIPITAIIDRKGKIVWKDLGAVTQAEIAPVIEAALNAK